jgi:hypothetical protein
MKMKIDRKEKFKKYKYIVQNHWNNIERPNLQIMGIK